MTNWSPETFSKLQTTNVEAMTGLTNKMLDGLGRLLELNLQTMLSAMTDAQESTKKAMAVREPQQFFALQMELLQPATDGVLAYRRQVFDILAATRAEFDKVLEAQYAASGQGFQDLLNGLVSNAPVGSPTPLAASPLAACQGVVNATNAFYESMQATMKQAIQVAENGFYSTAEAASNGKRNRATPASQAAAK